MLKIYLNRKNREDRKAVSEPYYPYNLLLNKEQNKRVKKEKAASPFSFSNKSTKFTALTAILATSLWGSLGFFGGCGTNTSKKTIESEIKPKTYQNTEKAKKALIGDFFYAPLDDLRAYLKGVQKKYRTWRH